MNCRGEWRTEAEYRTRNKIEKELEGRNHQKESEVIAGRWRREERRL
jgi:hypothetical protein